MALNPLLSLIGRLVARSGRKRGNRQTDRQNDRTTTITLAAHARRGLIILYMSKHNDSTLFVTSLEEAVHNVFVLKIQLPLFGIRFLKLCSHCIAIATVYMYIKGTLFTHDATHPMHSRA